MADPERIEQDLHSYLDIDESLNRHERLVHLKDIFDKHFAMDRIDHLVNIADLNEIVSFAKQLWVQMSFPIRISKKEVRPEEVNHVIIMKAFIGYLNNKKLLKKLVRFDITR